MTSSALALGSVLAAGGVTFVAAPVTGVVAGWADAVGVVIGLAIVTAFFCVSGLVVAWAGRINDTFTLPAALGAFFVKALILFALLSALPADGWLDRLTLAWTVVAGALLWSGVQLRWVWTRKLYYVPPPAPPPSAGSEEPPAAVPPGPPGGEKPAPRG